MVIDGYKFVTDSLSKFHKYLYISGWFHHRKDRLLRVELDGLDILQTDFSVGLPHGGVEAKYGPHKGFEVSILRKTADEIPESAVIIFTTHDGNSFRVPLLDLAKDRIAGYPAQMFQDRFTKLLLKKKQTSILDMVVKKKQVSMLDIGGRARSKLDRSSDFPGIDVTVLDILKGDNVDVVGDAHELSRYFGANSFDAVFSVFVFEHLLMPWKVMTEINKVLKKGGIGFILTHQTLGMHDMPWDFWRFSDTAWDSILNKKTGFRIIDRVISHEQYIIPFIYRPQKRDAERSAGFEVSAVLFEQTGPCQVEWPVSLPDIASTMYPDNDDGHTGERDII